MMTRIITFKRKGFKIRAKTETNGIKIGSKLCFTRTGALKDLLEILRRYDL